MGVYIFTWEKLRQYLMADAEDPNSSNDFGKNIIPAMLDDQQRMFAYDFEGYWKDVGTIESLWEANMDLLATAHAHRPVRQQVAHLRPQPRHGSPLHRRGRQVSNSLITEGCEVYGTGRAQRALRRRDRPGRRHVQDSVVMPGAVIERGAQVRRAIVAEDAVIGAGATVGEDTGNIAVVGQSVTPARRFGRGQGRRDSFAGTLTPGRPKT